MNQKIEPQWNETSSPCEGIPLLKAQIVYEDSESGLRAQRVLDRLAAKLRIDPALIKKMWAVDLLGTPTLRQQAAADASSSDVLILSVNGDVELPATVQDWMNGALDDKAMRPFAFGVLLGPGRREVGTEGRPVVDWVRRFAEARGADFFWGSSDIKNA